MRTGYEIREGSRILAARRKRAKTSGTLRAVHEVAAQRMVEKAILRGALR